MDELTTVRGVGERRRVIALIDIFEISDRILVLRRGKAAGERKISETDSDEVVKLMVEG